jgi:hypothetical protein
VDDDEAACSSGKAWGTSNRRRRSPGTGGSDRQIEAAPASIEWVAWSCRSRDGRRSWWCAWFGQGSPLFIEGRGCCGAVKNSTMARRFRRARELGDGAGLFCGSWRSVWRRQRGRAALDWVALLPCLPRQWRDLLIVSGGGPGFVSRACPTGSCCHGDAQRVEGGARGCLCWRGGRWPVLPVVRACATRPACWVDLGARSPASCCFFLDNGECRRC